MEFKDDVARFRAESRITALMKNALDQIGEIYLQGQNQIEKLGNSLCEMEEFLFEKYGIEIDLAHLAKHAEFLDDNTHDLYRKRIFDYCANLKKEL